MLLSQVCLFYIISMMRISPVSDLSDCFLLFWNQVRMLLFQTWFPVLRPLPSYLSAAVTRAHHVGSPQHIGTAFGKTCWSSFSRKRGAFFSLLWSNGVKQQKMSINLNHILVIPLWNTDASLKEDAAAGLLISKHVAQRTVTNPTWKVC